ncbi:unannotated protein [freshwater metagenome]|uniref:Unannotated protein n=1 Tax=freshwater metagenome TaxID=449393 RepID=A0A6J7QVH8_9ZZZZ
MIPGQQPRRRRQQPDAVAPICGDERLRGGESAQHFGEGVLHLAGVDTEYPAAGALGVEVDHEYPLPSGGGGGGETKGDGGLADTTLLVENSDNASHEPMLARAQSGAAHF